MNIDRTVCKSIRDDVQAALDKVGKKYGVALPMGRISFSTTTVRFGVKGVSVGKAGVTVSKDAVLEADFKRNFSDGTKGIGDTFMSNGSKFTIIGSKSNRPKYPIIATGVRGGRYKFQRNVVGL